VHRDDGAAFTRRVEKPGSYAPAGMTVLEGLRNLTLKGSLRACRDDGLLRTLIRPHRVHLHVQGWRYKRESPRTGMATDSEGHLSQSSPTRAGMTVQPKMAGEQLRG